MHVRESPIPDVTSRLGYSLMKSVEKGLYNIGRKRTANRYSFKGGFCPLPFATIADLYLASTDMATHPVAALCLAALLLGSCFGAPTIRTTVGNTGQQQQNSDVLARLQDRVSISCMDGSTSRAGNISVNGVPKGQDGQLTIDSMSVEDQGRYKCCVDDMSREIAIISESESGRRSLYMPLYRCILFNRE